VIFIAVGIFNLGIGMIIPILPIYAEDYGATPFLIGLMISALPAGRFISQGVGGYLADTYDHRIIASMGMAIFTPTMLMMATIPNTFLFILLRFIEGLAEGVIIPALYTTVARSTTSSKMGTAFGMFTSFATIGLAAGPVFGGFLVNIGGMRSLFLVTAAMSFIVASVMYILPIQSKVSEENNTTQRRTKGNPFTVLAQWLYGEQSYQLISPNLFSFVTKFAFASLQVLLPLYLTNKLGITDNRLIGIIFTINFIVYSFGQPVAGWLSDRIQSSLDMLISGMLLGVSFMLLPLAPTYLSFIAIFIIEAFAAAWITVGVRSYIAQNIEQSDTGKAFGVTGSIGDIGGLSGPLIVGALYQVQPVWSFWIIGLLALTSVIVSFQAYKINVQKL